MPNLRTPKTLDRCREIMIGDHNNRGDHFDALIRRLHYLDGKVEDRNASPTARSYHIQERRATAWAILRLAEITPEVW